MSGTGESGNAVGDQISDLWWDEGCRWHVDYDDAAGSPWPWIVVLEWMQEGGSPHGADFTMHTWLFHDETVEAALREALQWLEQLEVWRPCLECDGQGAWNGEPCVDCASTGLLHKGQFDGSAS